MKKLFVSSCALLLTVTSAGAENFIDPFVLPSFFKSEKKVVVVKEKKKKEPAEPVAKEVAIFKSAIPKNLTEMVIEGIIGEEKNGSFRYSLVVSDRETGKVFILREGDAVSPNEKIVKILPNKVVLEKYYEVKGKLEKEEVTLEVNSEEQNNE